ATFLVSDRDDASHGARESYQTVPILTSSQVPERTVGEKIDRLWGRVLCRPTCEVLESGPPCEENEHGTQRRRSEDLPHLRGVRARGAPSRLPRRLRR